MSAKDNLKQKIEDSGKQIKQKRKLTVSSLKKTKDFEDLIILIATDLGYIIK